MGTIEWDGANEWNGVMTELGEVLADCTILSPWETVSVSGSPAGVDIEYASPLGCIVGESVCGLTPDYGVLVFQTHVLPRLRGERHHIS